MAGSTFLPPFWSVMKSLPLAASLLMLATTPAAAADADPLTQAVKSEMPGLIAIYRDLHAHPELSFEEVRSAAKIADEARKAGFQVTTGVGKTGVVAVLKNGPGPVLLIRTDMDALPVAEDTGLAFASTVRAKTREGADTAVMHACGHDVHMTTWIAVARRMAATKDRWSGTLVMIGQPAEEIGSGAKAMLDDGLYTRFPKPAVVLAFHDSADLPAGVIGVNPGYAMANVDSVDMTVRGVGAHGAAPQASRDPIVLAARIVTTLQTLVSREMNPVDPSVITVGSFHAGTKHNIIPDEAKLQITVRSYTPEARKLLLDGIARIARGEAIAAGVPEDRMPIVIVRDEFTPATLNTQPLADQMAAVFAQRFGKERVWTLKPAMVGEDFSQFLLADKSIQSLMFRVGAVPQAKWDAAGGDVTKLPSLHSAHWAPDAEIAIQTASEAMVTAAMTVVGKK
jgi:amidohydrolase